MPNIITIADFWDCEIEHCEVKLKWTNPVLLDMVAERLGRKVPRKWDTVRELCRMAESRAVSFQWDRNDKILTFEDESRLALIPLDANTMKGSSRVMGPGDLTVRSNVRGGKPHIYGITKTAWHWTKNGKVFGKPSTSTLPTQEVESVMALLSQ